MQDPIAPTWLQQVFEAAHSAVAEEVGRPLSPMEVNDGYCRLFAEEVLSHADDRRDALTVYSYGMEHTWIGFEGAYYDAERREYGAQDPSVLPFFNHPSKEFDSEKVVQGFPTEEESP